MINIQIPLVNLFFFKTFLPFSFWRDNRTSALLAKWTRNDGRNSTWLISLRLCFYAAAKKRVPSTVKARNLWTWRGSWDSVSESKWEEKLNKQHKLNECRCLWRKKGKFSCLLHHFCSKVISALLLSTQHSIFPASASDPSIFPVYLSCWKCREFGKLN